MKAEYSPEELLPLSGIQHFQFCRRQWALIHVERQWQENALTVDGKLLHQRADDPFTSEARGGVITARAMPVASYRLGLIGVCDVVEFTPVRAEDAATSAVPLSGRATPLPGRVGRYRPTPVEYKRGAEKADPCDELQLCAQGLCLEEMLSVTLPGGFLFYGETRRRVEVPFTPELRGLVERMAAEMHEYFSRGYTPRVKTSRACRSCSLRDLCLPELESRAVAASTYIQRTLQGE
jgi:CRISPR-associated exonuclease Cas4